MGKDQETYTSRSTYGSIPSSSQTRSKCIIYYVVGKSRVGFCRVFQGQVIAFDSDSDTRPAKKTSSKKVYEAHCQKYRSKKFDKTAWNKLLLASILCFIFMVAEALGGYFSRSLAIATDAAHLLTDFASYMISLFALWVASRPASKKMPFGWYRAEVLGALVSIMLIWLVTGELVYLAVMRLITSKYEIDSKIMLITSVIGVLVNFIIGFTLRGHGHGHGATCITGAANLNVRAAFIHVIGDILQSLGVCIAAIVIYLKPEWSVIDPICTFIFSILVLVTTCNILKDSVTVLFEGFPKEIDYNEVMEDFMNLEGVETIYNLKIWTLTPEKVAVAARILTKPNVKSQNVLMNASKMIHKKYNFFEMTLQIERMEDVADTELEENSMEND